MKKKKREMKLLRIKQYSHLQATIKVWEVFKAHFTLERKTKKRVIPKILYNKLDLHDNFTRGK